MVMQTLQIRLPKKLLDEIDKIVKSNLYSNRSDVIRDAVRRLTARYSLLEQASTRIEKTEKAQEHYIHYNEKKEV